ncbi:type II toxin-antitoxin system RelE family toxin [Entomospira culicis]|uniref:Type II toxin-antitoxin system RelE/ParE family toxin n=1 Tax=Entomospira culicis TaxID=2719989 RepID=A0A968L0C5_9SPIO|nr:type II toxin-antitoxin system RelE/ParE family toxin [Entomospira culicis]NIZ19992.1 type II toxin-antitoxin system RelE/ParE family toxin [Entomospira culicis]NIZ70206.1 type II toxin-antitoxin system RelE/ParE family toxin [Entomospira culicis]WDI38101.1 type II toxin-antitoxin system RelE/ParE family toxin [Entomospira culicis]WDI39723.1 type II toxin-antitoxin system RelE/ParE family toxin [Entomospira culicis]
MTYTLHYTTVAIKALKKLDRPSQILIMNWIEKHLIDCEDPRSKGKALKANLSGAWRYRIGDYRIIAEIDDSTVTILLLAIGHRKAIYNK